MKSFSLYFSPTGGGKAIARAVQLALHSGDTSLCRAICLNKTPLSPDFSLPTDTDVVLVTLPVYGGHMPPIAKTRLQHLQGRGDTPAVLIAVYGNRAFEKALSDMADFVKARGFRPFAVAAFPCEHSYSTPLTPIAPGRPDNDDLRRANEFGEAIRHKFLYDHAGDTEPSALPDEESPAQSLLNFKSFIAGYAAAKAASPSAPLIPDTDVLKCTGCNLCIDACPTAAISADHITDPALCIKCCACVKACPASARSLDTPFAMPLSQNFYLRKSPRWLL